MADNNNEGDQYLDIHYEPLVHLEPVNMRTLEEEEDIIVELRAKLFRFDNQAEPVEWKERGVGHVKILEHTKNRTVRIVMRRDKTLKICANHCITNSMQLKPSSSSDRAWVWSTHADYADEEVKPELLAIRFANAEIAWNFKTAFEEAQRRLMAQKIIDGKTMDNACEDGELHAAGTGCVSGGVGGGGEESEKETVNGGKVSGEDKMSLTRIVEPSQCVNDTHVQLADELTNLSLKDVAAEHSTTLDTAISDVAK